MLNDEISIENIVDLVYYKINECVCFVKIVYTRKEIIMYSVTIQEIKDEFELVNLTDEIDLNFFLFFLSLLEASVRIASPPVDVQPPYFVDRNRLQPIVIGLSLQ